MRALFEKDRAGGVPADFADKLRRVLLALQSGPLPDILNVPGYGLHAMTGDRRGAWSVVTSRNWRVTFAIDGEDAVNVDSRIIVRGTSMRMHSPPHPGTIVKYDCLEPLGLTVTAAAEWLGVTRPSLSHVLNGQAAISPAMALRLEAAGWGVAEGWLRMQLAYDLSKAKLQFGKTIKVKRFPQRQPEPA